MARKKPPIDERYMDQSWFIESHTICSELREAYNVIENKYAKKKLRVAVTMAKAMAKKLARLREGKDMTWECEKCGNCCKGFALDVKPYAYVLDDISLMEVHDVPIREGFTLYIPHRCKHLTKDNLCDIWYNRPQVCRGYFCEGNKNGTHHTIKTVLGDDYEKKEPEKQED